MNRGSRVRLVPAEVTREWLRQHVAKTGHTARYVVEHVTVYRPKHPPTEETEHG